MKLRIKGNSIRLRLSQSEIDEFIADGQVLDSISFGDASLTYQLQSADRYSAVFIDQKVVVSVPASVGTEWANSDQVEMKNTLSIRTGEELYILIEKDFKCLTDRPNEDESDLFENPLNKHDC